MKLWLEFKPAGHQVSPTWLTFRFEGGYTHYWDWQQRKVYTASSCCRAALANRVGGVMCRACDRVQTGTSQTDLAGLAAVLDRELGPLEAVMAGEALRDLLEAITKRAEATRESPMTFHAGFNGLVSKTLSRSTSH